MTLAAAIIISAKRRALVADVILPAVRHVGFDEIVIVGDFWQGPGYRWLDVPTITGTTVDALVKRDAAALATTSDAIAYFCDDHQPDYDFAEQYRAVYAHLDDWDVLVPRRWTMRDSGDGHGHRLMVPLNMGAEPGLPSVAKPHEAVQAAATIWAAGMPQAGYCAGHGGIFRRRVLQRFPWVTMPHNRLWDLYASQIHQREGLRYRWTDDLTIFDVEPGAEPWK